MKERDYLSLLLQAWKGRDHVSSEEIARIAKQVRAISRGLTGDRLLAGSPYLEDPSLFGAYLCYYWPISYRISSFLLSYLMPGNRPVESALDLGAGAGPVTLALLEWGAKTIHACDWSGAALAFLTRIGGHQRQRIKVWRMDLETYPLLPPGPYDLITLGNVLNELWKNDSDRIRKRGDLVKSFLPRLSQAGRVLIFEPASETTARELLRVRDLLTKEGSFFVEAPCFRQGNCPALPNGTCHTEIPWKPPPLTKEIGRRARVSDRHSVKTAYLLLRRADGEQGSPAQGLAEVGPASFPSPEGQPHRIISDPLTSKSGRVRYLLCGPEGKTSLSADARLKPKSRAIPPLVHRGTRHTQNPFETFFSLKRGDVVVFEKAERRETGFGLRAETVLKVWPQGIQMPENFFQESHEAGN